MTKLRILGPRERLDPVLRLLQELEVMHLAHPALPELDRISESPRQSREHRFLLRMLEDIDVVFQLLGESLQQSAHGVEPSVEDFARWARLAGRLRRRLERLRVAEQELSEERALILKYRQFFTAFESLLSGEEKTPGTRAYHVIMRSGETGTIPRLRAGLEKVIGSTFALLTHRLPDGDVAVLLLIPVGAVPRVDALLAEAGVQEMPVPEGYGGGTLSEAVPVMRARLEALPTAFEEIRSERKRLARAHSEELAGAQAGARERLMTLDGRSHAAETSGAFVVEGWVPSARAGDVEAALAERTDPSIVVRRLETEDWKGEEAPVVLHNPRLFRPFEAIMRLVPLPRYGTIDPTPFVGVFFPMFFGIILGDAGYGIVLAALAGFMHWRTRPDTIWRSVAEIAGACAAFTIVFGIAYGEAFGDVGARWFGMHAVLLHREEAVIPFLILAAALGFVHIMLGLILGAVGARKHPRHALGKGLTAVMMVLVLLALLAAIGILPGSFFTPVVIALLVAFPILVVLEGIVAPIEFLATLGNVLSYARIMAVGTASVMMAVAANKLAGAIGSVAVGLMFALLFHLVNFALGVFSPTIHVLRLHYVEFFGKAYNPGGQPYRPFGRWQAGGRSSASTP